MINIKTLVLRVILRTVAAKMDVIEDPPSQKDVWGPLHTREYCSHISGKSRDHSEDQSSAEVRLRLCHKVPVLHSRKRITAPDSDHDSSTILDEDVEMAEETKGEDRDYSSYKEIARIQSSLDSQCSKAPSCMTCHCVVEQGTLHSYFAIRTTENPSCMLTSLREAALICKDTVDQPTC